MSDLKHLINFSLVPLDEVPLFTSTDGCEKFLHWYALSYGEYWLDVGPTKLFESSAWWLERFGGSRFDSYQVAWLWEGLLEKASAALMPLPDSFASLVESFQEWHDFCGRAQSWAQAVDTPKARELHDRALGWWLERQIDSLPFVHPPRIWCWRSSDVMNIEWDNRSATLEGHPVWAADVGRIQMPVELFIAELGSFNQRFIASMQERVELVLKGHLPEAIIDLERLEVEHQERSAAFPDLLNSLEAKLRTGPGWDEVKQAIKKLEEALLK